jgi:putative ABC transport system permease protein
MAGSTRIPQRGEPDVLEQLLLALRAIRRNLMRSFLTILGIVIGVGAVITMVTLGNGATRAVSDQISSLGSNLVMVRPGKRLGPAGKVRALRISRLATPKSSRRKSVRCDAVAPVANKSVTVVYAAHNWSTR